MNFRKNMTCLGKEFNLSVSDKMIKAMIEYSEDAETLKKVVNDCQFYVKLIGADFENRYQYNITIKRNNQEYNFKYTISSLDSFYLSLEPQKLLSVWYDFSYLDDMKKKFSVNSCFIPSQLTCGKVMFKCTEIENHFIYNFLTGLKDEYFICIDYTLDEFAQEFCEGMKITEIISLFNNIQNNADKLKRLFTEQELTSFPS